MSATPEVEKSSGLYSATVDADGALLDGSSTEIVPFWSFTKTLVASCALILVGEGKLSLDALLPGKPYSMRLLLQHRAGVVDYGANDDYHRAVAQDDEPWSDEELFARMRADHLKFEPRTSFEYSNIGYLIARRHLEHITGLALEDLLPRNLFSRLELQDCRVATSRDDMRTTVFGAGRSYHPGWVYPGLVIGPVSQAALALHRLLHWDVIPAALRTEMRVGHCVGENLPDRPWVRANYAMGLMTGTWRRDLPDSPGGADVDDAPLRTIEVIGHGAGGPGSTGSVFATHEGRGVTVAVFASEKNAADPEWEARRLMLEWV